MPPTVILPSTDSNPLRTASPAREAERQLLAAITRQHEAAVFTYLHRRVRRSVDVSALTQDVFARLVGSAGLTLSRDSLRPRLLQLAEQVLEDFTNTADPHDAAWTVLCLELDQLARSRQAGKSA
jgi:hypothetical protein